MTSPLNGETWLICGGRHFNDYFGLSRVMAYLIAQGGCPERIIHGDAQGADKLAGAWGRCMALTVIAVPAQWATEGRMAGVIRNQRMLDLYHPSLVVAFPGGKGTTDMMRRARRVGVNVAEVTV